MKTILEVTTSNISVASGAKQIIYNAFTCTINAGDEVIVPAPYWVSYPDIVKLNGGVPVFVTAPAEQRFKMTQQQLADALTPRTKWLVLNSPNNPSGAIYSEGELRGFAQVLRDHPQVHVMTDDIYEHLIYDGLAHSTFAHVNPDFADRTLTINGVSKTYAMTGFRIGYASGPVELIKAMEKLQSQSTSNPSRGQSGSCGRCVEWPAIFLRRMAQRFTRCVVIGSSRYCTGRQDSIARHPTVRSMPMSPAPPRLERPRRVAS